MPKYLNDCWYRLERDHPDVTWVAAAQGNAVLKSFPFRDAQRDPIYLVDPLGNVVLRYPKDADPSRMKKDLERLLRVSRIG